MAARREQHVNDAVTTLNEVLDASETVITMTDGSVFPTEGDCRFIIGTERFKMTSRTGNDVTAERGVEGSIAATHSISDPVKIIVTEKSFTDFIKDASALGLGNLGGGGNHRRPFRLLDQSNSILTLSDFTWLNQGSASVANDPWGGITMTVPETGTTPWKLQYRTSPSPPYILTANLVFGGGMAYGISGSAMGLGFRESSSGKLMIGQVEVGDIANFNRWLGPSSFSAAAASNETTDIIHNDYWLQVEDDNTDLIYRLSTDGVTFYEVGRDARTVFMAGGPNQIAWFVFERGEANKLMHLRSWIEE